MNEDIAIISTRQVLSGIEYGAKQDYVDTRC